MSAKKRNTCTLNKALKNRKKLLNSSEIKKKCWKHFWKNLIEVKKNKREKFTKKIELLRP